MKSITPLLKIHMRSVGPDGEDLETETWASWPNFTPQGVLARWKRMNPSLAAHYDRHEVVTPQAKEEPPEEIISLPRDSVGRLRRLGLRLVK